MPTASSIDDIMAGGGPGEFSVLNQLFEAKRGDKIRILTEVSPELIFPLSVLNMVAKRFKSKVLSSLSFELSLSLIAKDRKGRLEYVEVMLGIRRGQDKGLDD